MAGSPILSSGLKAMCLCAFLGILDDLTHLLESQQPISYHFLSFNTPHRCEGIAASVRQEFLGSRVPPLYRLSSIYSY